VTSQHRITKTLRNVLWLTLRATGLSPVVLRIHPRSALKELGWYRSFRERCPVDRSGAPVAWWTYPAIDFLESRLQGSLRILEYGCGHSTIWLSKRAREVISLENNPEWAQRIRSRLPVNAQVILTESLDAWPTSIDNDIGLFNVVVIDAGNRIACARNSCRLLSDDGVFIWDNTDGPDWPVISRMLEEQGFRSVSFRGMIPQEICLSTTTVLYRPLNCLGI
jgi:hypothetical protein